MKRLLRACGRRGRRHPPRSPTVCRRLGGTCPLLASCGCPKRAVWPPHRRKATSFCKSASAPTPIASLRMTRGKTMRRSCEWQRRAQPVPRRGRCARVPRRHRDRAECGGLFNLYLPGPRQLGCCETRTVHRQPDDTVSINRDHGIIGHEVGRPRPWFPFTTGYLSRRSPRTSCGLARRRGVQRSGYGICAAQVSAAYNLGRWLPGAGTRVSDLPPAGPRSASSRGLVL
jgi:hypothetical protein